MANDQNAGARQRAVLALASLHDAQAGSALLARHPLIEPARWSPPGPIGLKDLLWTELDSLEADLRARRLLAAPPKAPGAASYYLRRRAANRACDWLELAQQAPTIWVRIAKLPAEHAGRLLESLGVAAAAL